MHGQVSCLVGCLACRGSVWTPCVPLLYQSCKVKHYLLKTMYFFVQTRSHRECQCSRLGLQCCCSGLKPPPPRLLPESPTRNAVVRKADPERALDPHAWFLCDFSPGLHLITTVPFLTGCPQDGHGQAPRGLGVRQEGRRRAGGLGRSP
uniref:Uncharacterized protein n=1 Tax=Myotis myotis TaxID=51298 RepID=A0A7J7U5M7_MYOMY|nr:hypothetical protein mMyoMyo1_008906 [Myotis myotis]